MDRCDLWVEVSATPDPALLTETLFEVDVETIVGVDLILETLHTP